MFKSDELQAQFERNGYVVVPFFTAQQAGQLLALYHNLQTDHDIVAPVHSTSDTNKEELIRKVDTAIREIVKNSVEEIFFDSHVFLTNFLVKEAGNDSEIPPHQDWTLVDETQFASVSAWCPLIDITKDNGCITVLDGSYNFFPTLRSSSPEYQFAYSDVEELMKTYMAPLLMKAGEALIYHHALVHGSLPNLSGKPRPVVVLGVIPNQAQLLLHYRYPQAEGGKVEKFLMDTETFMHYKKLAKPAGAKSLGYVNHQFKKITREELLQKVDPALLLQKAEKPSLLSRLRSAFS